MLANWISNVHVHSSNQGYEFLTRSYNGNRDKAEHCLCDYFQFLYYFCISWKKILNEKMYSELRKRRKILKSEIFAGNTELIFEMSTTIELHWIILNQCWKKIKSKYLKKLKIIVELTNE